MVPTTTYDQAVMDLPTVKASVKAWEKAFKASHKRDPTKDDIKRDSSGIGECSLADRNKGSADGTSGTVLVIPPLDKGHFGLSITKSSRSWSHFELPSSFIF